MALKFRRPPDAFVQYELRLKENLFAAMTPTNAIKWFSNDGRANGFEDIYPNTYSIFDEISDKKIEDSIRYLRRTVIKGQSHPSIYGIKIERSLISIISPLALIGVMLFLLAHLKGLYEEATRQKATDRFPSVLFYNVNIVMFFAGSTVVVLPVFSTSLLIYRFGGGTQFINNISIFLIVAMTILGLYIVKTISDINRLLEKNSSLRGNKHRRFIYKGKIKS